MAISRNGLALVATVAALAFAGWRVQSARPGLPEPEGQRSAQAAGSPAAQGPATGPPQAPTPFQPPTAEERARMREEVFEALDLTPDQREALERIREQHEAQGFDGMRAGMQQAMAVLTPEQQQKLGAEMGRRFAQGPGRAMQSLPPEERAKLMRKIAERGLPFPGGPGGPPPPPEAAP